MPNNDSLATSRLLSLRKNLDKKGLMERYDKDIDKLHKSGYAENVPPHAVLQLARQEYMVPSILH